MTPADPPSELPDKPALPDRLPAPSTEEPPVIETFGTTPTPTRSQAIVGASFSGPIPLPTLLAGYKEVAPGSEREIIEWAAKDGEHRRYCDREELSITRFAIQQDTGTQRLGMVLSFVLALVFAGVGVYAIYLGRELAGGGIVLAALASLVYSVRRSTTPPPPAPPDAQAAKAEKPGAAGPTDSQVRP